MEDGRHRQVVGWKSGVGAHFSGVGSFRGRPEEGMVQGPTKPCGLTHVLGGTNLTYRVVGAPKNGQKVSLLALVANSETRRKIQFPKTPVWGSYFILFHCQQ